MQRLLITNRCALTNSAYASVESIVVTEIQIQKELFCAKLSVFGFVIIDMYPPSRTLSKVESSITGATPL